MNANFLVSQTFVRKKKEKKRKFVNCSTTLKMNFVIENFDMILL